MPSRPPRPAATLLAASLAVLLPGVLAGCGGEEPGERTGVGQPVLPESAPGDADLPEVPDSAELRTAVRGYADALLTGDAALAYAYYTPTCRTRVDRAGFAELVRGAGATYGEALPFASYDARVTGTEVGSTAEVDYGFRGAPGLVQTDEAWELTDDGWRLADC